VCLRTEFSQSFQNDPIRIVRFAVEAIVNLHGLLSVTFLKTKICQYPQRCYSGRTCYTGDKVNRSASGTCQGANFRILNAALGKSRKETCGVTIISGIECNKSVATSAPWIKCNVYTYCIFRRHTNHKQRVSVFKFICGSDTESRKLCLTRVGFFVKLRVFTQDRFIANPLLRIFFGNLFLDILFLFRSKRFDRRREAGRDVIATSRPGTNPLKDFAGTKAINAGSLLKMVGELKLTCEAIKFANTQVAISHPSLRHCSISVEISVDRPAHRD
jgi:hypothetical protein